jgi:hypothetical protein
MSCHTATMTVATGAIGINAMTMTGTADMIVAIETAIGECSAVARC